MNDSEVVRQFIGTADPAAAAIVERLAAVICGSHDGIEVAVKWHRLTFASAGDYEHWLCGVAVTRRGVTLTFHFGGLLDDPDGRLTKGDSRFLRRLDFQTMADVDEALIVGFVRQARERLPYFRANWRRIQAEAASS